MPALIPNPSVKSYGFFPGCSLVGSANDYVRSVNAAARALNAELVEIPDWVCCGSTSAHSVNRNLALSLPAFNLALAQRAGMEKIFVPCAQCLSRFLITQNVYETDPRKAREINEIIEFEYNGGIEILNIIQFIEDLGLDAVRGRIKKPLSGIKVACYYGCLMIRPPEVTKFSNPEAPDAMEKIIEALGAEAVEWNFKTECCGAGFSLTRTQYVLELSGKVLMDAVRHGAQAVAVACPMCHMNLDFRQAKIRRRMPELGPVPVFYITDLIGKALGIEDRELGIDRHWVKPAHSGE